jgi:hypothetical protein
VHIVDVHNLRQADNVVAHLVQVDAAQVASSSTSTTSRSGAQARGPISTKIASEAMASNRVQPVRAIMMAAMITAPEPTRSPSISRYAPRTLWLSACLSSLQHQQADHVGRGAGDRHTQHQPGLDLGRGASATKTVPVMAGTISNRLRRRPVAVILWECPCPCERPCPEPMR